MPELYKNRTLPFRPITGDIVLRRNDFRILEPHTYLSTAIRAVDSIPYNHCGVIIEHVDGTLWLYEARAEGVVRNPLFADGTMNNSSSSCVAIMRTKDAVPDNLVMEAVSLLGTPYDIPSLVFYQVVYRLPKYLNLWADLHLKEDIWIGSTRDKAKRRLVCSEFVGLVHGIDNWWTLSTGDILKTQKFYLLWEERNLLAEEALFKSWE